MPMKVDSNIIASKMLIGTKLELDVNTQNLNTINTDTPAQKVLTNVYGNGQVDYKTVEIVDESAMKRSREALLEQGGILVKLNALKDLESFIGKQGDENSFAHLGNRVGESFHTLAASDRDNFLGSKRQTFGAINNFLSSMKNFSSEIQTIRQKSEDNITTSINDINQCLKTVAEYNSIVSKTDQGDYTAVQEQRSMLNILAKNVGLYSKMQEDGTISIYSDPSGKYTLVDKGNFATFSYTPQTAVDSLTTFSAITATYFGQTFSAPSSSDGNDLTNYLSTLKGPLSSNLYIRDTIGPSLQEQLNKVCAHMYMNFNEIHNKGVSTVLRNQITGEGIPGSSNITGSETLDPTHMTGTVRFALMNSSLKLATPGTNQSSSLDVDLSQFQTYLTSNNIATSTINDFVGFLNSKFTGSHVGITASISNNQFTLTATDNTLGIAIGESQTSNMQLVSASSGIGMSEFFGLNNLFSSNVDLSNKDLVNQIQIRQDIFNNQGNGLAVGQLIIDKPLTQTSAILSGTAIAESISDSWKNDVLSFSSTSTLGARQTTLSDYLKTIVVNHEELTNSTDKSFQLAETAYERASNLVNKTSKLSREELNNRLSELAIFQKYIINLLQISYAMMNAINDLAGR